MIFGTFCYKLKMTEVLTNKSRRWLYDLQ